MVPVIVLVSLSLSPCPVWLLKAYPYPAREIQTSTSALGWESKTLIVDLHLMIWDSLVALVHTRTIQANIQVPSIDHPTRLINIIHPNIIPPNIILPNHSIINTITPHSKDNNNSNIIRIRNISLFSLFHLILRRHLRLYPCNQIFLAAQDHPLEEVVLYLEVDLGLGCLLEQIVLVQLTRLGYTRTFYTVHLALSLPLQVALVLEQLVVALEAICLPLFWMPMNRVDIRVNHRHRLVSHWIGPFILEAALVVEILVAVVVVAEAALRLVLQLHLVQVGFDDISSPPSLIGISFPVLSVEHGCLFFSLPFFYPSNFLEGSSTTVLNLALRSSSFPNPLPDTNNRPLLQSPTNFLDRSSCMRSGIRHFD